MKGYTEFATLVAREAGELIMKNYGKMQEFTWKSVTNFKTKVDDACDQLIRKRIMETYPKHSIISEENRDLDQGSKYTWSCDPLDGTNPYAYKFSDHFTVSIGLLKGKEPISGVIYAPKRNELYVAEKGCGAFCNGTPIQVCSDENINHALMCFDVGVERPDFQRSSIAPFLAKLLSPDGISVSLKFACASITLCFVAKGIVHSYLVSGVKSWDIAAGIVITKEAGARVTTVNGKDWKLGDESLLVANPVLHDKLLRKIKS